MPKNFDPATQTTIDTPPTLAEPEYQSAMGRSINNLRHGRRIPYDDAVDLMEQGSDLPGLTASYSRFNE